MSFYYPTKQPPISLTTLVRVERRLPLAGEVTVRVGTRVDPGDIVARTLIPGQKLVLDLARELGVKPKEVAKLLRRKEGEQIEPGEVIAGRRGIGGKQIKSPVSAELSGVDTGTGSVTLTPMGEMFELDAHLKGIVMEVFPLQGVSVETPAAVVRGLWGMGGDRYGVLKLLVTGADEPLTADLVDAKATYAVVVGGAAVTADALKRCIDNRVRGVIVGSMALSELRNFLLDYYTPEAYMAASDLLDWPLGRLGWQFPPVPLFPERAPLDRRGSAARQLPGQAQQPLALPFTLIVTEGFGQMPMSNRAFDLLAAADGQEVTISGTTRLRGGLARPEVIIPLPRSSVQGRDLSDSQTAPAIHIGSTVRLIAAPYIGGIAKVTALPGAPRPLPSGLTARVAEVALDNDRLLIPIFDLEVLD